jgi:hypothetical protein
MKIGVMQGRLSPPVLEKIQEFPKTTWENEFLFLFPLGLHHIEWIVTKTSFPDLSSFDVKARRLNHYISGVCCDHLVDSMIDDKAFVEENLIPVCEWCVANSIKTINIPLLEASALEFNDPLEIAKIFDAISIRFPSLEFCFEIEDNAHSCLHFLRQCSRHRKFWLIYDTGNIHAFDADHETWISRCMPFIKNVHLKDRNKASGKSVELFTGGTPFSKILRLLAFYKYNGIFTLQTARGPEGAEIQTITRQASSFKKYYDEIFV